MMDFMFFVKMFAFTLVIVLLMQIPVNQDETVETQTMMWVQTSGVGNSIKGISRGAAKLVHDLSHKVSDSIHINVNKNKKGDAALKKDSPFNWTHSSKPVTGDNED